MEITNTKQDFMINVEIIIKQRQFGPAVSTLSETVWACSQHIIVFLSSYHVFLLYRTLLIPLMNQFCRLMLVVAVS
jgi:hypothetical protein